MLASLRGHKIRSVLVTYVSNLGNFPRTVRDICPGATMRLYIMRRVHGSVGCMNSGGRGRFLGSLGYICRTMGGRSTRGRLLGLRRG